MNLTNPYVYKPLERITRLDGIRHYVCPATGNHIPSVTTILSQTGDRSGLDNWREWVGTEKADKIRDEAGALGTLMHTHLENYVLGEARPRGTNMIRKMAEKMSDVVIAKGLCDVTEVWGSEVMLHIPALYAGTTDLVGCYKGVPAVMDFKTAKKMKKMDSNVMQDYCAQAAAYTLSHNFLYDTNIRTCVIFMVDRQLKYETFVITGKEFDDAVVRWEQRVMAYFA